MTAAPVLFRKGREPDDIFALFPTLPADNRGYLCTCYQHIGQHSSADYFGCIDASTPAKPSEYKSLAMELRQRGYKLKIVQRATPSMHEECRRAAKV